jgi:hypothetical protein
MARPYTAGTRQRASARRFALDSGPAQGESAGNAGLSSRGRSRSDDASPYRLH